MTTLSGPTIWRLRQRGEFPQPVQLSPGRKGYRRTDIEQYLQHGWKPATTKRA